MMPSSFGFALVLATVAKGAILVALVAAVIAVFRVRSASLKHAFWTSAVLAHLAVPALTILLPPVGLRMPHWVPSILSGPEMQRDTPAGDEGFATFFAPAVAAVEVTPAAPAAVPEPETPAEPPTPAEPATPPEPGTPAADVATAVIVNPAPVATTIIVNPPVPAIAATPEPVTVITNAGQAYRGAWRRGHGGFGFGRGVGGGRATRHPQRERSLRDAMSTVLSWPSPSPFTVVWVVGALLVLARLAAGTSRVARLAHTAQPVVDPAWLTLLHEVSRELQITRPIKLMRGNRLSVPVTWGIVYPVVLLPPDADGWAQERRRHVLVHELAHVGRFDALTQLAAQCVLALFWFDPLVWYAVHRMRVERERACDDVVLRRGAAASRYASDLLEMVRALDTAPIDATPAFATLAMARKHDFEGRMLAILDPKPDRRVLGARGTAASTAALAMMLIPLSAMRVQHGASTPWEDSAVAFASTPQPEEWGLAGFDTARKLEPSPDALKQLLSSLDTESAMLKQQLMQHDLEGKVQELHNLIAAIPAVAPISGVQPQVAQAWTVGTNTEGCEKVGDVRGNSTSIHSDSDDDHSKTFVYTTRNGSRCAHVEMVGEVMLNDDQTEIARIAPGAHIVIEERSSGSPFRRFSATNDDGTTIRDYSEDGRPASFDSDARAWLTAMIQEFVRESGVGAKRRVSVLRERGGVPAVLAEIDRINSTGAKRAYYEALLDGGELEDRDVERIVAGVGKNLSSSDGDLSAVLAKVPVTRGRGSAEVYAALDDALGHIGSDGDRARTLTTYVGSAANDRDLLLVVLRATRGIGSDGDKAAVLMKAGPEALASGDDSLRMLFFRAARSIGSDGDLSRLLVSLVKFGHVSPATTRDLIQTAKRVGSDGDKANVLMAISNARLLTTRDLQDAFIDAARSIGSDGDYRRVMESTLRR